MPMAASRIGVQWSGVQVDPHWVFLGRRLGQRFSSGGKADCCTVAPEFPIWRAWGPGMIRRKSKNTSYGEILGEVTLMRLNRDLLHLESGRGSDIASGWRLCP